MKNHPDLRRLSTHLAQACQRTHLASGRSVSVLADDAGERVEVRSAHGTLELTLEFTPLGARLHVAAVDIALHAAGSIRASCEHFELAARASATIRAAEATVESTEGDVTLRAHDDVRASGERVLLNCDREDELPGWMKDEIGAALRSSGR